MSEFQFEAQIIHWRGPSPFFFAPVPPHCGEEIRQISKFVTYGWGMIPVEATIRGFMFSSSLFPKNEGYLLPLKDKVRRKLDLTAGDMISIVMSVRSAQR
ncbi:DUF1905 domain-containing protein [Mesorhizobium amorphae]